MKAAYEQAKAHFLANRNTMSSKDMAEARDSLNAMYKEMQTQEAVSTFKAGDKVDIQTFLLLLQHFNIEYTNEFNEWVQNDVVMIGKQDYDSYKISKVKAKQLQQMTIALTLAV